MVQNCNNILNKVIFLIKILIYDFLIAKSFYIVNFSNSLWIKICCRQNFGILQSFEECLVFWAEVKSNNLVDLVDHLGGRSVLRGSLGIFSGWLSKKQARLPGVDGAVTSTEGVVLSILQGV